jgi:hypothetical protein
MASAAEAPPISSPSIPASGCGNCTYAYNPTDGCYHRRSFGCSGNCTCALMICGLGSLLIQRLYPESVANGATVALPCSSSGSDDEAGARSMIEVVRGLTTRAAFWRNVSIGLGILSGLLAIGLVIAIVYR